ncbi:hypothetical protein [Undibacter mobilis]|uniref:CobQ/CobB/MinD/ParA nucleotide binding domain-containing protein n=1 Tax=Undibacter mobilis TaxID=2292256 RepID=A0A371B8T0_9BRAD|nr:hypothetical protein [Undibacter mobilis]RDV04009.1 hypothetical protein DXH78_05060 [Undibacter mobilis]
MSRPAFVLIGADKGGVGKTTVTRTFVDYLAKNGLSVRAFDTEWPRGALKRFYPQLTDVVDVTQVHNQIKIFDEGERPSNEVTVIDVRAGLLSKMLETLQDVGFLEFANRGHFNLVVLHILGPTIGSLDEISDTGKALGNVNYILVKNFINDTKFFEWQPETYSRYFSALNGAKEIVIPKLNELACENVELAHVPYSQFIADRTADGEAADYSFVLRGYVRHWLTQVWSEYDRLHLADSLGLAAIRAAREEPQRRVEARR